MRRGSKICQICNEEKSLDFFHINLAKQDGLNIYCKSCESKRKKDYYKTKKGLSLHIYNHQWDGSKLRGHPMPEYTKKEFREWLFSQPKFHELCDEWAINGYKKLERPSVDRINDYVHYKFGNIQLMSFYDNVLKWAKDAKEGRNRKSSKAIVGVNKSNGEIVEFYSVKQAGRELGIDAGDISKCCLFHGGRVSMGGYIWRYSEGLNLNYN